MLIVALFIVALNLETTQMPITGEWINKLYYIHTVEYYSAVKIMNQLLLYATTWTDVKIIMLIEEARQKKHLYCMIVFI